MLLYATVLVYWMMHLQILYRMYILIFGSVWYEIYAYGLLLLCYQTSFEANTLKESITMKLQQEWDRKQSEAPLHKISFLFDLLCVWYENGRGTDTGSQTRGQETCRLQWDCDSFGVSVGTVTRCGNSPCGQRHWQSGAKNERCALGFYQN